MAEKNSKKILIIIIILITLFFSVLLFSILYKNTTVNYHFEEDIQIDSRDKEPEIRIGYVEIENFGVLPVREKINTYVLCNFDESQYQKTYILNYRGETTENYDEIFSSSYNYKYVDVSRKSSKKLYYYLNKY